MHFHSAYVLLARSTYIIRQHIGRKNRAESARTDNLIAAKTEELQILLLLPFVGRASFVSRLCHSNLPSDITNSV